MFGPFDLKNNPFANAFDKRLATAYHEESVKLRDRKDALKRTQKYTEELQKRQSKHDEDMANEFGAPSQVDRSWAAPVADLAKGLFTTYLASRTPKADTVQNSLNEMQKYKPDDNLWRPPS